MRIGVSAGQVVGQENEKMKMRLDAATDGTGRRKKEGMSLSGFVAGV